jgi:glycosyltransferase involved in cell wall biosynthesis
MKIALLPEYFYPYVGGGENWFKEIGSCLAKRGHKVTVFCFPMAGVKRREQRDGMLVRRVGVFAIEKWQPYLKRSISHIVSFISHPIYAERWDAVIGQGSALLALYPMLRAKHIRTFCVVHDIYGLKQSIQDKGLVKGLARHLFVERLLHRLPFTGWIAVSDTTKAKLEKLGVPRERINVIRNGVNLPSKKARKRIQRNSIVYIGRLVKHKHTEDLIKALSMLRTKKKWKAKIAGDGEQLAELQTLTNRLGLQLRVEFLGWIEDEEKWNLLFSAICLVLPSMAEGWGVVLTEAAASGAPSVAYDLPAVREQASLIPSIIVVKPRRSDELAARIDHLIEHHLESERLGRLGKESARNFTWETSARQLESLLNQRLV